MLHTIYPANGKSVTFTGACANEIIPSIKRSFVYKAKEGRHFRITGISIYLSIHDTNVLVRCCIYLTTYDWIKSFLKITIKAEPYMEI